MPFINEPSVGSKGHKLTPKMRSFIDQYMIDLNATQAVVRSDYSTTNNTSANRLAAELMAHPLIKEEIGRRLDKKSQKVEVKAEYLINKLQQIVENTQEDNPQAAIRAIELLGKTIAIWRDRQEVSGPDGEAIKHEQHIKESVDEFTSRISRLAQRTGTASSNVVPIRGGNGRAAMAVEVLGETEPEGA